MPLALVVLAAFLILTGVKGNYAEVGQQFDTDVAGQGGFFSFLVGILGIAILFRLIGLPNAGKAFLTLVIVVYLLQNANVLKALQNLGATTAKTSTSSTATQ